jgi:molecular chaperone DnaK
MNKLSIGIDLGTTNSAVCVFKNGQAILIPDPTSRASRPYLVPSIVVEDNEGKLIVGDHSTIFSQWSINEAKRDMGSSDYNVDHYKLPNNQLSPVEVSTMVLKKLIGMAKDATDCATIEEAVITVPANFSDIEKTATKEAAELAGILEVHLIAEPTAAFLAYAHDSKSTDERAFVFDFGGGTLDISIVDNTGGVTEGKGVGGDKCLGGKEIDHVFSEFLIQKFLKENSNAQIPDHKKRGLKGKAEEAKILLSSKDTCKVFSANFAQVDGTWINLNIEVSRQEFENSISDILAQCKELIRSSLKETKVKPSEINTVLLVGGSVHIPAVRELVISTFGAKVTGNLDPDTAVACGACIRHAMLNDELDAESGLVLMDISRFGFGVETADIVGGFLRNGIYSPLMNPQTHFPFEAVHDFALLDPNQESVKISVYQSDKADLFMTDQAISTGVTGTIENIPPSKTGVPHKLEVLISADENNLISVTSRIPDTGQILPLIIDEFSDRLSDSDKSALVEKLSNLDYASFEIVPDQSGNLAPKIDIDDPVFDSSKIGIEAKPLVKKALELRSGLPQIECEEIEHILTELCNSLKSGNVSLAEIYRDKLTDTLFDLEEN